jgi:hypothetical protein
MSIIIKNYRVAGKSSLNLDKTSLRNKSGGKSPNRTIKINEGSEASWYNLSKGKRDSFNEN